MGAWLTTGVSSSDQSSSSSLSPSGMSSGVRNFNSCSLGKLQAPRGIGKQFKMGLATIAMRAGAPALPLTVAPPLPP